MKNSLLILLFISSLKINALQAQTVPVVNTGTMYITAGTEFYSKGNFVNQSPGTLTNAGSLRVLYDLTNDPGATLEGSGKYNIGGNWGNTGTFTANSSEAIFYTATAANLNNGSWPFYKLTIQKTGTTVGNVTLAHDTKVTSTLKLAGTRHLILGDFNLTLNAPPTGGAATHHLITNGTGAVIRNGGLHTAMTFPVSFDAATYNPLIVKNNGTNDDYIVRCLETMLSGGSTGSPLSNTPAVSWEIGEFTPGGSNLNLTTQWGLADEQGTFNRATCAVTRWTGAAWDITPALLGAATGANPYKRLRNGFTGVGFFGVASTVPPTLAGPGGDREAVFLKNLGSENVAISVFPNPATEQISVVYPTDSVEKILVFDEKGALVIETPASDVPQIIPVASLSAGMYFLKCQGRSGRFVGTGNFVKTRL